jgi:hypothetical protein
MADPADAPGKGEDRRRFIKRLAYMAPVMETFLLKDTAEGQDEAQTEGDQTDSKKKKKPKPSKPRPKPRDDD